MNYVMKKHLQALSYRDGDGVVAQIKRQMEDGYRCLFIGFGGTGLDALEKVNSDLRRTLPEDQYRKQIAVLAVDTAKDALYRQVKVEVDGKTEIVKDPRFDETKEWCMLPYEEANSWKQSPHLIPNYILQWMNPSLMDVADFTGDGANGIRQTGRMLLSQPSAVQHLQAKVEAQVHALLGGAPTSVKLKVFLFFGIAGGTGSGTVIDGSYLIRHFVDALKANVQYCGYIFLPAVGKESTNANHRNAYAALKEIDHFMTLERRKERFVQTYDSVTVNTDRNLFDMCVLMEGRVNGVLSDSEHNRFRAFEATSDSILDNITALPVQTDAGAALHSIDEYLNNTSSAVQNMVKGQSQNLAPRAANYAYASLGHARAIIPIDLMKAYIMNMVFQKMRAQFAKCAKADEKAATDFLKDAKVIGLGSYDDANKMRDQVDLELKNYFINASYGPSFVVNLLNEAVQVLPNHYANATFARKKREAQERICRYLSKQNNTVYKIYTTVIREMSTYLQQASGILTSTEERKMYSGSTFSWMLVDFAPSMDKKSAFVKTYLDGIITPGKINALVDAFLLEMSTYCKEWTELETNELNKSPAFCAEKRLRSFIRDHVDGIISASVEDYLVKLYSQNPKAVSIPAGKNLVPGSPEDQALDLAAKNIVNDMLLTGAKAIPLLQRRTTGMLPMSEFPSRIFMFVPETAPNLFAKIEQQLKANTNAVLKRVQLFKGTASDSISCYWRYDGLPAFQVDWVLDSEKIYESTLQTNPIGLHMSETNGGRQWRNYPNLCNQDMWDVLENGYTQPREAAFATAAKAALEQARTLGMTESKLIAGTLVDACHVTLLDKAYVPDASLLQAVDVQRPDSAARQHAQNALQAKVDALAQAVYDKLNPGDTIIPTPKSGAEMTEVERQGMMQHIKANLAGTVSLQIGNDRDVLTPYPCAQEEDIPADWTLDLAAKLLRTNISLLFTVRANVLVVDKVAQLIEANNTRIRAEKAGEQDLEQFAKLCCVTRSAEDPAFLLAYRSYKELDEDNEMELFCRWNYIDADGYSQALVDLNPSSTLEMSFKHYYAFLAYKTLPAGVKAALADKLADRTKKNSAKLGAKNRFTALKDALTKLRTATKPVAVPAGWTDDEADPMRFVYDTQGYDTQVCMGADSFALKVKDAELAQALRDFYKEFTALDPEF